MTHQER